MPPDGARKQFTRREGSLSVQLASTAPIFSFTRGKYIETFLFTGSQAETDPIDMVWEVHTDGALLQSCPFTNCIQHSQADLFPRSHVFGHPVCNASNDVYSPERFLRVLFLLTSML